MRTEMLMPQMGESIAEATIIRWHKNVGDTVKKDETILEISTDKVDSEIPSPESGVLTEIMADTGATVEVQTVIAIIETEGSQTTSKTSTPTPKASPQEPEVVNIQNNGAKVSANIQETNAQAPQASQSTDTANSSIPSNLGNRVFSPLVRNIASQHGIEADELAEIAGTGAHGRVTKDDLLHYIDQRNAGSASTSSHSTPQTSSNQAPQQSTPAPAQVPARIPSADSYGPGTKIEPFDSMRKAIADHMVKSKQTSPHVYSVAEIDMTKVSKWRAQNKSEFKSREGFNLSYMPFFLEAIVKALTAYPKINSSIDGDNLVYKRDINLGCAVALGEDGLGGLIVPNIKNAGSLNFLGIARGLNDIANRARSKKLNPQDVQGGTFTVTNIGGFGNIIGYPIISQPQLGILALGAIKKRPVVVDDAIAVRDICYITLSYDHRAIDGALGGHFLKYITDYLENWDMNRSL